MMDSDPSQWRRGRLLHKRSIVDRRRSGLVTDSTRKLETFPFVSLGSINVASVVSESTNRNGYFGDPNTACLNGIA
jgi:hypothetical protein